MSNGKYLYRGDSGMHMQKKVKWEYVAVVRLVCVMLVRPLMKDIG